MKDSKIKVVLGFLFALAIVSFVAWYYFDYSMFTPSPLGFVADVFVFGLITSIWATLGDAGFYNE